MIGAFCAHARKELREQRMLLVAGVAILLLELPATAALEGFEGWTAQTSRLTLCFVGAMMFLATIAGDLLCGDRTRKTRDFLARTPRGLPLAFWVKFALLLTTAPLLPLLGWLLGSWSITESSEIARIDVALLVMLGLTPLWVFACGAFVSRPILALPTSLIVLIPWLFLIDGPLARMATTPFRYWVYSAIGSRLAVSLGIVTVFVLLASLRAFSIRRRAALAPIAVGSVLAVLPLADVWYRATEPTAHELRLEHFRWSGRSSAARFWAKSIESPHVLNWPVCIDLRSGALTKLNQQDLDREFRPENALYSTVRLPNGDVVEHSEEAIVVRHDGQEVFRHPIAGLYAAKQRASVGYEVCRYLPATRTSERLGTIDPLRKCFLRVDQQPFSLHAVTTEGWVIANPTEKSTPHSTGWRVFDPISGGERAVSGLGDGDRVSTILLDGRLLVTRRLSGAGKHVTAALVDLGKDTRSEVRLDSRLSGGALEWWSHLNGRIENLGEDRDWFRGSGDSLFFLRRGGVEFEHFADDAELLASLDDSELLVLRRSGRELCALPLDGSPPRMIFPR